VVRRRIEAGESSAPGATSAAGDSQDVEIL
jgi:hypothetical protein